MGKDPFVLACSACIAGLLSAGSAGAAEPGKPAEPEAGGRIRILVVTGGHPFETGFWEVFDFPGCEVDRVNEEATKRSFLAGDVKGHDAIVLYDLWQVITEEEKAKFTGLLAEGQGLVVLHHAMADYQKWPEYRKIMGGRFFLAPLSEGGVDHPQSTATAVQKMKVKVADPAHPITRGIADFEAEEEPYGKFAVEPGGHELLTTDCPASGKVIGWCHTYGKARVATIQLGHDSREYKNPAYRKIVERAIRWAAGKLPGEALERGGKVLSTLKAGHPRIILTGEGLARLRELIERDEGARKLRDSLRRAGERLADDPKTVEFKIVGPRLLDQSRRCLQRVYLLSLLFRLDGDARFCDRAVKELAAAAAFPNWNPSHFLDTAEMTHAFAIGYDWLFGALSDSERAMVRGALVEKGLKSSLEFYREKKWWVAARHNWNQVCNGGISIGALAVADEEAELAESIVSEAIRSVRLPMAEYAPDGAWSEGPGYWHYATSYNVYMLAALESALGTDFGLSGAPGFAEAGLFRIHSTGPIGQTFNFADAGAGAGNAPEMFWLARKFDRPVYAWEERRQIRGADAHDLIWYDPRGSGPRADGLPLCARFRDAEVACLRSAWEEPKALYVGFKGGDNRANHSHLDLGTFVLDALGARWAQDLGGDDYNMPGYFGDKRWTYYRLKSEGHNIVTLAGENQDPRAKASLVGFGGDPRFSFAVADLAAAYPGKLKAHRRGVAIAQGKHVLVLDEIETAKDETLHWTLQTAREIQLQGDRAEVARGDAKLTVRIVSPEGQKFEVLPASGPPPEAQAPEIARLLFKVKAAGGEKVRIAVLLTPHSAGEPAPEFGGDVKPLEAWGKD